MSPTKRKVFLVLECGSPHGVGNQVATIASRLNRDEFEPWVIYAVRPGASVEEFEKMTAAAARRVHVPEMVRPVSPAKDLAAFWTLYRLMRRERPDVVHAESSKAGVLARAAAFLAGVPRIYYSPHGYSFLQTDAGPLGRALYRAVEKAFSWIGNIIACSKGEAELARGLSWGREVFLVRNLFTMEDPPARVPGAPGTVLIGALGRLTPARRPDSFLRLAEGLAKDRPGVRFVWIGGGELEPEFRKAVAASPVANRLEVTGHLPRARVLEKLAALDVFVHYSAWEGGAPIAMHEAMACGKPVLASNIAGNVELAVPGVTGYLASDEAELLRHAAALADSAELRERLGRGARDFLRREVSIEKSMAELERLYRR